MYITKKLSKGRSSRHNIRTNWRNYSWLNLWIVISWGKNNTKPTGDIARIKWCFLAHLTKNNTIPVTVSQRLWIFAWFHEIGMNSEPTTVFTTAQHYSHTVSTQLPNYTGKAGLTIHFWKPPSFQGCFGRWTWLPLGMGEGQAPSTALCFPSSPMTRNATKGNRAVRTQVESQLLQSCSCTFHNPSLHSDVNSPSKWHYRSPFG